MKIVILGPAHPLRGGGMTTFNERMARALKSAGHEVTIYSFSLQYPSFMFPGSSQFSTEPAPTDLDIVSAVNSINPPNWIKVGRKLKKLRPDLIIVRYWLPLMGPALGTILRLAKKNKHTKVICIADNVIPHEKRPGDKIFTKYFVGPVDAFLTMSKNVMQDLRTFTLKPAKQVVHPLYDNFGEAISKQEARAKLAITENAFVLLFFGFIRKYKGLDMLLEAMPAVIKAIPGIQLLIAGEFYDKPEKYHEQIEELNISSHINLHTSFISDKEVKNYFCAADTVVQPYRDATQSGVSPLAYHFEKPMIVTNVGGLPDLVPDGKAGLVAAPEPSDIAAKIIEMHRLGAASFSETLREEKKKYSWDKMVVEIEGLYKSLN